MIGLLFALACHPAVEAEPVAAAVGEAFVPTDVQADMIRRLSMRDGAQPCAEVEAGSVDAASDLQVIVQRVELPPVVPMRAAECLIAKGDVAEGELIRWMSGEDTRGLAMLLADRIDTLQAPLAQRVVASGLAGPHAEVVRARVLKSAAPELRALAGGSL